MLNQCVTVFVSIAYTSYVYCYQGEAYTANITTCVRSFTPSLSRVKEKENAMGLGPSLQARI